MDRTRVILPILIVLALTAFSAAPRAWEKLGERTVDHAVDHDEIAVTVTEGVFRQIKLRVRYREVTFRAVRVRFANGDVQDIELRRRIPPGGETRAIDLDGKNRVIRKVVLRYNTSRIRGRRAVVELWGR